MLWYYCIFLSSQMAEVTRWRCFLACSRVCIYSGTLTANKCAKHTLNSPAVYICNFRFTNIITSWFLPVSWTFQLSSVAMCSSFYLLNHTLLLVQAVNGDWILQICIYHLSPWYYFTGSSFAVISWLWHTISLPPPPTKKNVRIFHPQNS